MAILDPSMLLLLYKSNSPYSLATSEFTLLSSTEKILYSAKLIIHVNTPNVSIDNFFFIWTRLMFLPGRQKCKDIVVLPGLEPGSKV